MNVLQNLPPIGQARAYPLSLARVACRMQNLLALILLVIYLVILLYIIISISIFSEGKISEN